MHHLPKIFDLRRQSKKMDQAAASSSSSASPRHKLVRRNAAKNFEYKPSASASASASASSSTSPSTSGSYANRTRSLDLPHEVGGTSLRVEGEGDLELIYQSLGISGPEAFEIPKAAYETMKNRSLSDNIRRPRKGYFDFDEPKEEAKNEECRECVETLSREVEKNVQISDVTEGRSYLGRRKVEVTTVSHLDEGGGGNRVVVSKGEEISDVIERRFYFDRRKFDEFAVSHLDGDGGGANHVVVSKGGGIRGDRPPLLTPPPVMSLPVLDEGCSTWELLKGLAPDGDRDCNFSNRGISHFPEEGEEDDENAHTELRIGETVIQSGSCSFTTTNDDDSSSTTTDPVSIISPNGPGRVSISHWMKGQQLGRGSFGTVYEGISSEGDFFAVKEVSLLEQGTQGKQSIYQLEQEIELLSQFEHENIVRYLGTDKDDSKLYIFLELVTQGSLASLYHKYHLRDSHVSNYARQILLGLKYLHDRNVVHRDIKCANILVASNGTVKLADFGLAKATSRFNDLKSCKGTAFWMAPEVVSQKNQGYGLPADIWSLGCTVLEMLTRELPYHPLEFMQALYRIGKGEPPPIPENLSRDARDFIQQCLNVNPNYRPTAADLLEHPFVRRTLYAPLGSESPMTPARSF